MLFPLNPQTQQCAVFELLNNELLHFLQASIASTAFSQALFTQYQIENRTYHSVCWSNRPTQNKFKALWDALPAPVADRKELFDSVAAAQNISAYFDDVHKFMPVLNPEGLYFTFKELTAHLYTKTKDLEGAKNQSDSSIEQHYQAFVTINERSHLCSICGTTLLSQNRSNLNDEDQWRSDYDHVLCKDKYPIFSVHPGNFLPTCHICNSKAKGARDLLRHSDGRRRTALYPLPPLLEACANYAEISIDGRNIHDLIASGWDSPINVLVHFSTAPANLSAKIDVWREVYQVHSRVEEKISSDFYERVSSDLMPLNLADFKSQLRRRVGQPPSDIRKTEWRFWWQKAYEFMGCQSDDFLNNIWALFEWKLQQTSDDDMAATYRI